MGLGKLPRLLSYFYWFTPGLASHRHLQCPVRALGLSWHRTLCSAPSFQNHPHELRNHSEKTNEIDWLGARLSSVVNELQNIEQKQNELEASEGAGIDSAKLTDSSDDEEEEKGGRASSTQVEICHPWSEWIEFVDRLVEGEYLSPRRANEGEANDDDDVVDEVHSGNAEDVRVLKGLRSACKRFGRERFDIIRSLSRRDIQIIVGSGCPSLDGKVVTSAKRLRAFIYLDEGDVCSSCSLRASCERAYIIPRRGDIARTVDVMRILLTYAYYPLIGSAQNEVHKVVKLSVRKLLKQVVKLSATSLNPNLRRPVSVGSSPKINQFQTPPIKNSRRADDIEMKKGDWLCPRCDFMNFAKNNKCLQCDDIRPKRKLNLGEWECPGCGFVNYRRNLACYKCECNRPQGDHTNYYKQSISNWDDDVRNAQQFTYTEWMWKKPVNMEDSPESSKDDFNNN